MAYIGQSLTEGTRRAYTFVATSGQTTFNAVFGVGAVDVFQNGILLQPSDYNSSSGSSVVLGVGAAVNDEITIIAHNTFSVADTVSSSQGGTFTGNVSMSGTLGVTGAVTASNGLTVDDDGATVLTVDRATSNGDVIDIQKDGTSVGTIGANGSNLYIGSPEGTDAYIGFGNNIIRPVTSAGASRDNAIDLGYTGMRFKDLYLSGGAYLGGTGASNKLSDVETGTWTPALTRTGSNYSHSYQLGTYEKIGRLVVASFSVNISSITTQGSGYNQLSGLPFTPSAYNPSLQFVGSVGMSFALTSAHSFYWAGAIFFVDSNSSAIQTNFTTGLMSGFITYKTAA